MIEIKVRLEGLEETKKYIDARGKQAKFAAAVALTRTAVQVRSEVSVDMARVFDRPTPYTMNSLFLSGAKPSRLEAIVFFKENGFRPSFLLPQIKGGDRALKRFEYRLTQVGAMLASERAIPTAFAEKDAYGNVSRGLIVKILSQLKSRAFAGDYSVATNSARSRKKRAQQAYFVVRKGANGNNHLLSGIYQRTSFGAFGSSIRPIFLFGSYAKYKKRLDFSGIAERVVRRDFDANFRQAYADALRTAR